MDAPQNMLSQSICSTADSQLERDIKVLGKELTEAQKERDEWEERYWWLLDEIGGVLPG